MAKAHRLPLRVAGYKTRLVSQVGLLTSRSPGLFYTNGDLSVPHGDFVLEICRYPRGSIPGPFVFGIERATSTFGVQASPHVPPSDARGR